MNISVLALFSLTMGGTIGVWNLDRPSTVATGINCEWVGRILQVENSSIAAAAPLCAEDTLELETDARIRVLCYGSGEIWDVPSGGSRVGDRCTRIPSLLAEQDCNDPQGCYEDDGRNPEGNKPHILQPPSGTFILTQMPKLSWLAVEGATHYNIRIGDIAESEPVRETTINALDMETSDAGTIALDFPFEMPLSRDVRYRLTVEAVTQSQAATVARRNFSILNEEGAIEVREIASQLDDLNLPAEEKVLVDLHHLYIARNLKAEAIESLEALKENGSQNPQLYRMLGMLYEEQDWFDFARSYYQRGEELAIAAGNTRELDMIRDRLSTLQNR